MIETISNSTITDSEPPLPTGTGPALSGLLSVSCPSTLYCVAAGVYGTNGGNGTAPLIETLAAGVWTATAVPNAITPTDGPALWHVSCSWAGSCAAIGTMESSGSGFIETLTNGTWSETPVILPSNATVPNDIFINSPHTDSSIACVAGTCAFAGSYATGTSQTDRNGFINTYSSLTGYQLTASDGGIFAFNAPFFGSMGSQPLNKPIVGMAYDSQTGGYYEVASDGGIFAFNAPFYGSMGSQHLNKPIVGMAFDSRTGGYYEVASDGGIFAFNAPFYGSMGGQHLNKPIVGIAYDDQTGGYYEVASDGGIFAFNAPFHGSTGGMALNKPMVGLAVDTATGGYYEVASDGGIFAYGAPFQGSTGGMTLNKPVVGMVYDFVTGGYYEVASDGGIFAYGAPFQGSTGGMTLNRPIVGMVFG